MKRIIFCALFSGLLSPILAQSWFPIGATWYYNNDESIFFTPYIKRYGYYKYEVERDTVVNALTAKVISRIKVSYDGSVGVVTELVYREENQKIYFWDNTEYIQLYDFNLIKGDTLGAWFEYNATGCDSVGKFIVDSIYYHPHNSNFRVQQLNLKSYYQNGDLENNIYSVIEKVGANAWVDFENHLFFPPTIYCRVTGDITDNSLRCYLDNKDTLVTGWNYYNQGWPCDTLINVPVSSDKIEFKNTLQLSPNPTTGVVRLNNLPAGLKALQILSLQGAVLREESSSANTTKLDLSALPSGVYFITLSTEIGQIFTGKVVKQ